MNEPSKFTGIHHQVIKQAKKQDRPMATADLKAKPLSRPHSHPASAISNTLKPAKADGSE